MNVKGDMMMICKHGVSDTCKIKEGCKYCTDKPNEYDLLTLKILSVLIDEKEKDEKLSINMSELVARNAKKEILDIMDAFKINVAKNLLAWDSSKDKVSGLLPEVYYKNLNVYKLLTGKDYNFSIVSKEFGVNCDYEQMLN